ncbi:MAG: DUF2953 domain-containing protein [Bacillus sp. (in: firmicutes)]
MIKTILLLICVLVVLITLLLLSTVTVHLKYVHHNQNDQLLVTVKALYGIYKKRVNVPVLNKEGVDVKVVVEKDTEGSPDSEKKKERVTPEKTWNSVKNMAETVKETHNLFPLIKQFLKKIELRHFDLRVIAGTGDAAETGIVTGLIWTGMGVVQAMLYSFLTVVCKPRIHMQPSFNRQQLVLEWSSIISFRFGNAILTVMKLILQRRNISSLFRRNASFYQPSPKKQHN